MKLRRQNLSQLISSELLDRIRSGELKPGDRLPTENGLMEEFSVGRNAVREAIQHLVALNVVDVRPRRGITVTEIDDATALDALAIGALLNDKTVDDLYSFRMLIETAVAEAAAVNATPRDIARIEESLDMFRQALANRKGIYAADVAFHQTLASASGNVIYDSVLGTLTELLELYRRQTDQVPGAPEQALLEHTAIVDAIASGSSTEARTAMEAHIATAMQTIGVARDLAVNAQAEERQSSST